MNEDESNDKNKYEEWGMKNWRSWGSWFSWGSPVGLGIFLVCVGLFVLLLHQAGML